MGFSIPNPVSAVKNTVDNFVDKGAEVLSTTVNLTETAVEITKTTAVNSFQFQGAVTRFALEKTWDGAQTVGSTTIDLAGKGIDLLGNGIDSITHPGDPNPPAAQGLTFSETKSASDLAYTSSKSKLNDVFEFPDGKQWKIVDVQENSRTGFRAVALKPLDTNDKRVIVAYSGSDEGVDWLNNAGQAVGAPTPQYNEAVAFADKWKAKDDVDVILTGHSLGGGLASYASLKTDQPATAINSSPLALDHLGLNPFDALNITQYYVPGEALSVLNAANPLDIRPGFGIEVQGENSILDPRSIGTNHSLDSVAPDIAAPKYIGNFN